MTRERVVVQRVLALVTGSVLVGLALTAMQWAGSTLQDMGLGLDRQPAAEHWPPPLPPGWLSPAS